MKRGLAAHHAGAPVAVRHRQFVEVGEEGAPRLPPCFSKMWRISGVVRLVLSVSTSTMMATPPGPYPSYVSSSYVVPSSSPVPRLTARSILSFGMLFAFASATAARRRGLPSMSPPPRRAAIVISLMMRVKTLPRFASAAPFLCLMVLHLLWPDMGKAPSVIGAENYIRKNAARGMGHEEAESQMLNFKC